MRNIEYEIQKAIFDWADINVIKYPELKLLNASLNGVKLTSQISGYKAKLAGLKKGYPDLFLPVARQGYYGLFIELKRDANEALQIKRGSLTKEQVWWLNELTKQGYKAKVCFGFNETIKTIKNYLKI